MPGSAASNTHQEVTLCTRAWRNGSSTRLLRHRHEIYNSVSSLCSSSVAVWVSGYPSGVCAGLSACNTAGGPSLTVRSCPHATRVRQQCLDCRKNLHSRSLGSAAATAAMWLTLSPSLATKQLFACAANYKRHLVMIHDMTETMASAVAVMLQHCVAWLPSATTPMIHISPKAVETRLA